MRKLLEIIREKKEYHYNEQWYHSSDYNWGYAVACEDFEKMINEKLKEGGNMTLEEENKVLKDKLSGAVYLVGLFDENTKKELLRQIKESGIEIEEI